MSDETSNINELVTFISKNDLARFGMQPEEEPITQVTLNINGAASTFMAAGRQPKVLEKSLFYRLGQNKK